MYLWLHVRCLTLLPDFNQILNLSTDFHKSAQHKISHTSVQWEPSWYLQTDRCQLPDTIFTQGQHSYGDQMLPATIKCTYIFMYSSWYFSLILIKFGFSWQIFIHIPKTKFHESPSIGSNGDTRWQVEVKRPFSQLCKCS